MSQYHTQQAFLSGIVQEMTALCAGGAGTPENMSLLSSYDHALGTYERNASLWCASLVPQLTGCCMGKYFDLGWFEGWAEYAGGVMITKRHLLQCKHREVVWQYSNKPTIFRFVDVDGNVVDRTGMASSNDPQVAGEPDVTVTLLNEDVPDTICRYPLLELDTPTASTIAGSVDPYYYALGVSQGGDNTPGQKMMAYTCSVQSLLALGDYPYQAYSGDSGTPRFFVVGGRLAVGYLTGANYVGNGISGVLDMLALCDANAVASGALAQPTGYLPEIMSPFTPYATVAEASELPESKPPAPMNTRNNVIRLLAGSKLLPAGWGFPPLSPALPSGLKLRDALLFMEGPEATAQLCRYYHALIKGLPHVWRSLAGAEGYKPSRFFMPAVHSPTLPIVASPSTGCLLLGWHPSPGEVAALEGKLLLSGTPSLSVGGTEYACSVALHADSGVYELKLPAFMQCQVGLSSLGEPGVLHSIAFRPSGFNLSAIAAAAEQCADELNSAGVLDSFVSAPLPEDKIAIAWLAVARLEQEQS